jgi:hypothetical protein
MTDVTTMLKDALEAQGDTPTAAAASTQRTGRSGSGNLRNFKAMNDAKLSGVLALVEQEGNDAEALEAIRVVARERGWPV